MPCSRRPSPHQGHTRPITSTHPARMHKHCAHRLDTRARGAERRDVGRTRTRKQNAHGAVGLTRHLGAALKGHHPHSSACSTIILLSLGLQTIKNVRRLISRFCGTFASSISAARTPVNTVNIGNFWYKKYVLGELSATWLNPYEESRKSRKVPEEKEGMRARVAVLALVASAAVLASAQSPGGVY